MVVAYLVQFVGCIISCNLNMHRDELRAKVYDRYLALTFATAFVRLWLKRRVMVSMTLLNRYAIVDSPPKLPRRKLST